MNRLLILLYILGVYSCSRSTVGLDGNGNPCSQSNSILYSGVFLDSFDLILDNDTSVINELRFDCTINSFLVAPCGIGWLIYLIALRQSSGIV